MPRSRPDEDAVREQLRQVEPEREAAPEPTPEAADAEPKPGIEPADEVVPTRGAEPDAPVVPDPGDGQQEAPGQEEALQELEDERQDAPGQEEALQESDDGQQEDALQKAERERGEYLDLAQRTRAELDNFRKRAAREAAQAGQRAKANLVRELLPVLDNLERALSSAGEAEQHLAEGVRMVHGQLVAALEREGIEAFDPAGDAFDPECHEALSTREQEGSDSGLVLDVVEKGYRLSGTVLRPARVVVSA